MATVHNPLGDAKADIRYSGKISGFTAQGRAEYISADEEALLDLDRQGPEEETRQMMQYAFENSATSLDEINHYSANRARVFR